MCGGGRGGGGGDKFGDHLALVPHLGKVPAPIIVAAQLCRLAANQGEANEQCNLGLMYEHGTGVPQDHVEAARLFRLADDQGDAHAQYNLGVVCYTGTGVPRGHLGRGHGGRSGSG